MQQISDIRELSRAYYKNITKTLIAERKAAVLPEFNLDEYQKAVLKSDAKFLRVIAPAGAGKTQTLTAKAAQVLSESTQSRVLCLTFTNAAAGEFAERIRSGGVNFSDRIKISTVNSFGFEALKSQKKNFHIVSQGSKYAPRVYSVIKSLMLESPLWNNEAKYKIYQSIFELADLTKALGFSHLSNAEQTADDYGFIEALGMEQLLRAKISEVEIEGNSVREVFLKEWIPFWQELTKELWDRDIISLEDQKYWALDQITTNPLTLYWLKSEKITHVFVDEFQDINVLDLYFIQTILSVTGASLVIVGDDDQCLYEWRGCSSLFMRQSESVFGLIINDETFHTVELERNYRCPRNIVIHSKKLISRNNDRIPKQTTPVRTEDANIRVIPMPAAYMTMNVVDELVTFLAAEHPEHSVAVVGRKKSQLIPIQILLTKHNVRFKVDSDLNIFAGEAFSKFRKLLDLPKIYKTKRPASKNIEDLISLLDKIFYSKLSDTDRKGVYQWLLFKEPKTLEEAVLIFGKYPTEIRKGAADPIKAALNLPYFLESGTVVKCLLAAGVIFKGFQKDFVKSKEDIFYADPPFSHLADLAVNYGDNFDDFLFDIDRAVERAEANDPRSAKIELMTALRTKGREFDTVMVLDVNDGIFPNKKSAEEGRIEEERRIFYVTVTRTKNNLLLFDSGRINGKTMTPSPFIKELDLPNSSWLRYPQLDQISRTLIKELKI